MNNQNPQFYSAQRPNQNPNYTSTRDLANPNSVNNNNNNYTQQNFNSVQNFIEDPYGPRLSFSDQQQNIPQQVYEQKVQRKTDPNCEKYCYIVIAIIFLIGGIMILVGEPVKLSSPIDPDGRICGINELEEFPYIYFVTPSKEYMYRAVCVKTCPSLTSQPKPGQSLECAINRVVESCIFKISKEQDRSQEVLIYDTIVYQNKICMPKNVAYFNLVADAMSINKLQSALRSMHDSAWMIIIFTGLAIILSLITKLLLDSKQLLDMALLIFFVVSTVGFFLLSLLFFSRFIKSVSTANPDHKKVIEDDNILSDTVSSNNTSTFLNLVFSIICFLISIIFIYSYCQFEGSNSREKKELKIMRNKILNLVSEIISSSRLIYVPIVSIILCFFIFIFAFIVQTNVQASGSISTDNSKLLPFQRFSPPFLVQLIGLLLIICFIIIFILILQASQFLSFAMSYEFIHRKIQGSKSQDTTQDSQELQLGVSNLLKYRIGTITLSSFSFLLYPIRYVLESIDTSVQRRRDKREEQLQLQQQQQSYLPNTQNGQFQQQQGNLSIYQQDGIYWKIMNTISNYYKTSFLKQLQTYGFILTHAQQMNFMGAGSEIQKKIDLTYYWFEDMLEGGDIFETQMKFSISFVTTLAFYIISTIITSHDDHLHQLMAPTILMVISSLLVSNLFVNSYGTVYSSIIVYCLIDQSLSVQFDKSRSDVNPSSSTIQFSNYVNQISQQAYQQKQQLFPNRPRLN